MYRDVTKFAFENVNFDRFQHIQYSMNVLQNFVLNANLWESPRSKTDESDFI